MELSDFFTQEEKTIISEIKNSNNPWEIEKSFPIKKKIKNHFLSNNKIYCCYCQRNFHGEFVYDIDLEHILPKSNPLFKKYIFTLWNLNIACKRCNMKIKGKDYSFLISDEHKESSSYLIIHPNFDKYSEHLLKISLQVNERNLVKFKKLDNKGCYTYTYFRLNEIEISTFDIAQGEDSVIDIYDAIYEEVKLLSD